MFDLKMNSLAKKKKYDGIVAKHGQSAVTSMIVRLGLFQKKVAEWTELTRLLAVLTAKSRAVAQDVTTPRSAIANCVATPRAFTPRSAITPVGTPVAVTPTIVPFPWSYPNEFLVSTPVCASRPVVGKALKAKRLSMSSPVATQVLKRTTPTASPTASPKAKLVARSPMSSRSQLSPSVTWAQLSTLSPLCELPSTPEIRVRVDERLRFPPDSPRAPD
jgi:hypothetical protein